MAKKKTPSVITGKTGDEIIAERKSRTGLAVGSNLSGDDIIAQRKDALMPKVVEQEPKERIRIGGGYDFLKSALQKPQEPASPSIGTKPESTISQYRPTFTERLRDLASGANQKIKQVLYKTGAFPGNELNSAAESLIEKDIQRKAQQTGDDTLLNMYRSDKEFWSDNDKLFNQWLGRKLDAKFTPTDRFAQGAGEVAGTIAEIALVSELTAPLKIYRGTNKGLQVLNKMGQMGATGAIVGAERAYGSGADSEQILNEALKSAGFFAVGGAAADAVGVKMLQQLKPVYEKYPQYATLLKTALAAGRGFTFGTTGAATEAGMSKLMGEETPSVKDVVKTGLALAGAEAFLTMLSGIPYRGMRQYQEFQTSGARTAFDESLTAKNLKKNGYQEFKKGTGVWIKTDPKTGAQLDMQREMININGNAVFKTDIFLTEKKIGRKLSPKELAAGAKDPNYFRTMRGEKPMAKIPQEPVVQEKATGAKNTPVAQETRLIPDTNPPGNIAPTAGAKLPQVSPANPVAAAAHDVFNQPPEAGDKIIQQRKAQGLAGSGDVSAIPKNLDNSKDYPVGKVPEETVKKAEEFVEKYHSGPQKFAYLNLRTTTTDEVAKIKDRLGIDVTGYVHSLNSNDLWHTFRRHSDPIKEAEKGQVALTKDDLKKIPQIIDSYDDILKGSQNEEGPSIRYMKHVNGTVYYVEVIKETKNGKKVLTNKTMWKEPSSPIDASTKGTSPTSDAQDAVGLTPSNMEKSFAQANVGAESTPSTVNAQSASSPISSTNQSVTKSQPPVNMEENVTSTPTKNSAPIAKTGNPLKVTLFHGSGKSKKEIYSFAEIPIAGEGEYWALNADDAKNYGDKITSKEVELKNPLVITNDKEWRALTKEAGWMFPNPYGQDERAIATQTSQLKETIMRKGHDGLIIQMNKEGDFAKTLRDVFSHDQVIKYESKTTNEAKKVSVSIDERSVEDVGDRKVKAYMYEHPELKDFVQAEAVRLLGELKNSVKGKRYVSYSETGERVVTGTKRLTSEPLERIMNLTGASYAEIEDALQRIINNHGQENVSMAKKVELVIDDNLSFGAKTLEGIFQEPNYDYLDTKKQVTQKYEGQDKTSGRVAAKPSPEGLTSKLGQQDIGPASGLNTSGKAKRASEIVKDFENRLKASIKKGGIHWTRLGEFNNRTHIVRISKANDIATLSHEVGHFFDKLYDLSEINTLKKRRGKESLKIDTSLQSLGAVTSRKSYPKWKIRREGIAEFFREYFTDKNRTEKQYPELSSYVKEYVPREVMGIVETIAQDVWNLANLDPIARGMKSVQFKGDPRYPAPVDITRALRQVYTGIVDATYPVEWAAKELGGRIFQDTVSNELSTLRGWEGIALADINPSGKEGYYQADLNGKKVGPSYFEITKPIHVSEQTRREFWVYSIARRNEDYLHAGLEMPDSPETYQAQIAILEARRPDFKEIFNKTREFRANNYDLLVQGGVYSKESKEDVEKANPNYVSLKRIKEAFDYVSGTSQKLGGAKRVVKRRTGGGEDIMDPEESDITNTFIHRSVAMRNRLLLELADMADKVEGKGFIMVKSPMKLKALQFNLEKVKKYLYDVFDGREDIEEQYGDVKQFVDNLNLDIMVRVFNPQYLAGPNQVVVYREGEPELYDVHPNLYEAIKGLTPENMNLMTETLMGLAQIQKTGIIYTPQFIYRNAARDTFHNLISSESHLNPVDIFAGFYSALRGDKWYKVAQRKGGTTNYFTANDRKFAQDAIDQIMSGGSRAHEFVQKLNEARGLIKEGYAGQGLWAGFKSFGVPLKLLQDWIEPGEMGGRLAEMKKGIKKYLKAVGYSEDDIAAMNDQKLLETVSQGELAKGVARARNLSVDFRKMGKWIKKAQLNRLVNFLNPSIQGTVNVGRLLKKHPIRTTIKGLLYITIPTLFLMWLNWDNKYYHELLWWRRDFFWNVPIGNPKETKWFFPIPRPWELGIMFGALPERLINSYLTDNPNAWKEFGESVRQTLVPEIMPSAIEPFYRDATGRDWRGNPILSMGDSRVSPYLQYNEYTSIVTRKVAEELKDVPGVPEFMKSPKRFQRIIEGYTGTLGRMALESIDMTFGDKPGIPVLGGLTQGFVVDAYRQPQSISDYYDNKTDLDKRYSDANRLKEPISGEVEGLRKVFNAANTAMGMMEDALQAIERSDRPNRTLEVASIRADMIQLAKAVNEAYEKVMSEKN